MGTGPKILLISFLLLLLIVNSCNLFFKLDTPWTLSILFSVHEARINVKIRIITLLIMNIENLYSKILIESRNPDIFFNHIDDDLNNKLLIFLIFFSKIFNKIEKKDQIYQNLFDYIFNRIETDLRELGHGDMSVNKKMKIILTKFYSILVDFKNFKESTINFKHKILLKYFPNIQKIDEFSLLLDDYLSIDYK